MDQTYAKTRNFAILSIVLVIAIIAVGANNNPVFAQTQPCTAVLSYPVMPTTYSYSNVPIVVPMSATCTTTYGNQLYASGNAYDATSIVGLGTVNSVLQSNDGGTTFNGQLAFNLPSTTQGHTVTISVSLYSSQYGSLIGATSETFQAVIGNQQVQQVVTTTVTQAHQYPYQTPPSTPYAYQLPYSIRPPSTQQPSQQRPYNRPAQYQTPNQNNSTLLSYVAIAAILAAVVIATVGLVVYGRRQQPPSVTWVPPPPPPR